MIVGYARVSTADQCLDRQIDALNDYGCDNVLTEKMSGGKLDRPILQTMLDMLSTGDVVVVAELTRLSRSTRDLFEIVERIGNKGASIKSLKESWLDTTTPAGQLMFTLMAGISQFERDIIRQRTVEGLKSARARGHKGGRPRVAKARLKQALVMYESKRYTLKEIKEETGVSHATLYRYITY